MNVFQTRGFKVKGLEISSLFIREVVESPSKTTLNFLIKL